MHVVNKKAPILSQCHEKYILYFFGKFITHLFKLNRYITQCLQDIQLCCLPAAFYSLMLSPHSADPGKSLSQICPSSRRWVVQYPLQLLDTALGTPSLVLSSTTRTPECLLYQASLRTNMSVVSNYCWPSGSIKGNFSLSLSLGYFSPRRDYRRVLKFCMSF